VSYAIRRLTGADADAYRLVRLEALRDHPESYGSSAKSFAQTGRADNAALLDRMAFFGAFADGQLGGIVAFGQTEGERQKHIGWVYQVYVAPRLRGTGAALALMEAVVDHARGHVLQLHLGVGAHNAPAIRLYEKAGFQIYGTEPRSLYVNGRYIDEHMMVRFLDEAPGKTEHD
jgi:RimJ/RimL family protein N-acetyltransferase